MPRTLILVIAVAQLLVGLGFAQSSERVLMHAFPEGPGTVYVTIVDRAPAPVGVVTSKDKTRRERWFTVSHAQFDKMWSTLMSAGVEKYARYEGAKEPVRKYNTLTYYVFAAAQKPHGWEKNYAVPTGKAPQTLIALAKQFRSYAK